MLLLYIENLNINLALFFIITLTIFFLQKIKTRSKNRYPRDSFGSEHSCGSEDSQSVLSSTSSHSSASSCSIPSEPKSLTKHYSTKKKQKESNHEIVKKQKKFERNGIYLILISLTFTVFCGKVFGIILTLMWLYLFSLLRTSYGYKKKLQSCVEAKDRCQFGRSVRRELYHNNN
ncbi:hypothetical protein Lalb_Chr19g0135571 [Lupinus albus]|uniref:Transmembrane protein n=1 Tax=Lupinus albus TaxID=3870 RepID=A0A6A4NUM2_LUPAL|nr:hypothetical protein Lalb_Chr19g0135571 [Lupinus albus]